MCLGGWEEVEEGGAVVRVPCVSSGPMFLFHVTYCTPCA
jgi:hypothetical protein